MKSAELATVWKERVPSSQITSQQCAQSLGVSPVTARILQSRCFQNIEAVNDFWRPRLENLHEPELFQDMPKAAEFLAQTIRRGEKIVIWGDYDVDGATSVALLMRFFRFIGANVDFHIPHRLTDGYGLNKDGLTRLAKQGARVVVTVDNGIAACEEARFAKSLGIDLIVTDHHEPGQELPEALAIINPKREDCAYPDPRLAGVGVAFKLAYATARALSRHQLTQELKEFFLKSLALVALGTVADLVPLQGENRVLVGYGLHQLNKSPWPGLRALIEVAGCDRDITTTDIAFRLGPRVNAAGRLASADIGVQLMVTEDPTQARFLADQLESSNLERRSIEKNHAQKALQMIEQIDLQEQRALVISAEGWHPGVIGIVASRLVEKYHRPTFVVAFEGDLGKGSCRSVSGFHLHKALSQVAPLLEAFGGHAMAAGFTIRQENYLAFKENIQRIAQEQFFEQPQRSLWIDAWVDLPVITEEFVNELSYLAPYGIDNPPPVLAARGVHVTRVKRMGRDGSHLSFHSVAPQVSLKSVAYQKGDWASQLASAEAWDLAFEPKWNTWRQQRYIELEIKGLRPTGVLSL